MGEVLFYGPSTEKENIYPVSLRRLPPHVPALAVLHASDDVWHRRLGHCGIRVLDSLRKDKVIHSSVFKDNCVTLAKFQKL